MNQTLNSAISATEISKEFKPELAWSLKMTWITSSIGLNFFRHMGHEIAYWFRFCSVSQTFFTQSSHVTCRHGKMLKEIESIRTSSKQIPHWIIFSSPQRVACSGQISSGTWLEQITHRIELKFESFSSWFIFRKQSWLLIFSTLKSNSQAGHVILWSCLWYSPNEVNSFSHSTHWMGGSICLSLTSMWKLSWSL
jgi:hypothetical protein